MQKLLDVLEDLDDVQDVFHNAELLTRARMKVLVIGGGGREHALAWKLAQSPRVQTVYVAPGNGGTAAEPQLKNVADHRPRQARRLRRWPRRSRLTVVGPEAPLAAGVVDDFRAHGLRIFGPTQAAAQLESSKAFAKAFMKRHAIPTAGYEAFSDAAAAHAYVDASGAPIVVKADGLAAGKGVVVATRRGARGRRLHADRRRCSACAQRGRRARRDRGVPRGRGSQLHRAVRRQAACCSLATSQDHKRLGDGDTGPNTGGMGAYSPAPVVTPNVHARVMHEIILPTIAGMADDGMPFTGFLYAGLMIDAHGAPRTVEFNCRLGDPETQPILMRLKSDLFDVLMQATAHDPARPLDRRRAAMGPPRRARRGDGRGRLSGRAAQRATRSPACRRRREDAKVFHAGTELRDGQPVTAGGRVLCVTALGDSIRLAQQRAYEVVRGISLRRRAVPPRHRPAGVEPAHVAASAS